jgi:hypothetical protein
LPCAEAHEKFVTVKALLVAGLIVLICLYVSVKPKIPSQLQAPSDASRRFEVKIEELLPDGTARASGGYWELTPDQNEKDFKDLNGKWNNPGEFIIRNPPAGAQVGQSLELWMDPRGGVASKRSNKLPITMRAFDVVVAPLTPAPNRTQWMRQSNPFWSQ